MTFFYQEILKIGILLLFSIFLAGIILFSSLRLSSYNLDTKKLSVYECGFEPYEDARNIFDVRFYLVAILFIIFEAVFFFPWCVSISFLNLEGFWETLDFILGALYVLPKGLRRIRRIKLKYSYSGLYKGHIPSTILYSRVRPVFKKQRILACVIAQIDNNVIIHINLDRPRDIRTVSSFIDIFKSEGLTLDQISPWELDDEISFFSE